MKPIALQLYTVREAAAHDFPGVLRRVAEVGYKAVETAGLNGLKPEEMSRIVTDLGMKVCSSHTSMPTEDNLQEIVDTEMSLGNRMVVSGLGPDQFKTMDMCKEAVDQFNQAAELLKPHGMRFGIHNHWWEFETVDGNRVYDLLLKECPGIFSELDVYWAAFAKADPAQVVAEYSSRLPLLHIKDGALKENTPHLPVGSGVLDMPAIIHATDPDTLQWLIVELDEYAGDMFEAVQRSYDYLTSNGLASGNK